MTGRRLRSRAALTAQSSNPTPASSRPRRGAAPQTSAQIERSSPEETRQSIHLTVKAAPSKLREATSGGTTSRTAVSSRNILDGKRSSRNSRTIREPSTSEEEEEEEEEIVEDEEMEEDEDEDAEGEDDDDMDAEGEEDVEMEDAPPPPPVAKTRGVARPIKPSINVLPPPVSTVEAKETLMAEDDDDEELSELSEEEEVEEEDEGGDEDAEGEEEELPGGDNDEEDEDEDDLDSDDETPGSTSRAETPDLSKLTRRQRALVIEGDDTDLMALSNEAQKKKHLTAEEITMRRAEMARRRKNLSEKRNEEEKMDTINRLLKKQPSKRQRRLVELGESGQEEEPEVEKAPPLFVRYTQTVKGSQLAVPEEWLEAPAGKIFTGPVRHAASSKPFSGRMVEEVA